MKLCGKVLLWVLMGMMMLAGSGLAQESYKVFHQYFVDLKGWEGEEPIGMNIDMGGMKMITSARSYEKDDRTLNATVMIGGAAVMAMKMGEMSLEANGVSMKTQKIDGFQTTVNYDSEEHSGVVIVDLCKNSASAAVFMVVCEGIDKGDELDLAKKFDWKALSKEAKKLL